MASFLRIHYKALLLTILSVLLYWYFAYELRRSDFIELMTSFGVLFLISGLIINMKSVPFWFLAILGLLFRTIFIGALPNLSQDFYRFIWDGRIILEGINPYLITPDSFMEGSSVSGISTIHQAEELIKGMGELNASHHSNYPPANQFLFAAASLLAGKSILASTIMLSLINILADIGILFIGRKLLIVLNKDPKWIFWYFLNPFIIIELVGNLHFEGVMLFFLIWAIYLLIKRNWLASAFVLALSISVKLIPLLFLPVLYQWFIEKKGAKKQWKRLVFYYIITISTFIISFTPFISKEIVSNYVDTIGLWFHDFEFNASVYYIIRGIGYKMVGWNIIDTVGFILPIVTFMAIISISIFRNNKGIQSMLTAMLLSVSIYFLMSTTVHPWYIATPLILSIFTRYRYPIVWSVVVMLSYSAYGEKGFHENLWLAGIEYIVLISVFLWEVVRKKPIELGLKTL
jgi:hypothetical protein